MMAVAFVRPDILYAWKGPSLLIVNTRGECGPDQPLSGYYFREARFLGTLRLDINGEAPWVCEAASVDPESLALNFVHPEIKEPGGGGTGQSSDAEIADARGLPERSIDIQLSYRVGIADLTIVLAIANRARRPIECAIGWTLGADFADIQEAQAGRREQQAAVQAVQQHGCLAFKYLHTDLPFHTEIRYGEQWRVQGDRLTAALALEPQQPQTLSIRVVPTTGTADLDADAVEARDVFLRQWRSGFSRLEEPGRGIVAEVVASNVRDVASFPLLEGPPDEWLAMQAGMPLYPAYFGRDGVTAGWQAGYLDRGEALAASLTKLGRLQTDRFDDWRDEQPGRIPYQLRSGPLALLNLNPYSAYYADYASPLMFVVALANLWAWTGDRQHIERHWDTARRILDWARELGDLDRDGYLEYETRSAKGTKNQGWKDSGDAIIYGDGSPVPPPIATCELQGYWYIAQELMALMSWVMDAPDDARAHYDSARELKNRFNRDWWLDDEHFYALALDPGKRPVGAVTSNVGHCLACGIIASERVPAVVERMFAPDMFSGWGIRTLSASHSFYNPLSYHRGSVWAVEQATIAFGLRRFGLDSRAHELSHALFDLARLYPEYRIPECVGGYARDDRAVPGAYSRSNTPQLWNATAFPLIVQTLLGLVPVGAASTLFLDPALPAWAPELILRDVRVGSATVTLRFWRDDDGTSSWRILEQSGVLHVIRQPPLESLSATWVDRVRAAVESVAKSAG